MCCGASVMQHPLTLFSEGREVLDGLDGTSATCNRLLPCMYVHVLSVNPIGRFLAAWILERGSQRELAGLSSC